MMTDLNKFKGVIIALYACYDDQGNVSESRAEALTAFYREKGVRGLYVCGSSGEGFLMNTEERMRTLEAVMREAGDLTVIVHVGAAATHEAVALARHAASCGAHALSAVPSVYYRLSEPAIEAHWNAMIEATELPFIIYNIPQLTGYDLSIPLLKKMAANPQVIGVKNSSESTVRTEQFKYHGGKDFLVFNGPDEQYLAGRIMGAEAGIGGTYGVMPEMYLAMEAAFTAGNLERAKMLQIQINEIIMELLSFPSLYGAAKEIMTLRGVPTGTVRMPFLPVRASDRPALEALYQQIMQRIDAL